MAQAQIDDPKLMEELKARARDLKTGHGKRDLMFARYLEMYLLNWRQRASREMKHMQVTASPDFRNQVQGAVRLMVATDPQINVRPGEHTALNAEKVEAFLKTQLYQSGRLAGEPVHYPMITAGLLYDEMHAAITPTADMLQYARNAEKQAGSDRDRLYARANIARWEEIADLQRFIVEPWSPVSGYPEFGTTGLTAYYRVVSVTAGEILDRFGFLPDKLKDSRRSTTMNLHTFYDAVYTAIWVDGGDLLLQPHGLPRIPVVAQILNGSRMFPNPEDQRQPFGYTLLKSGLWNAQNISLTSIFTAVFNYALTPTKVYTPAQEGSVVEVNNDEDIINLHPGDRLDFIQSKGAIDPSMREAHSLAEQKGNESTIYPQALGAAVGGSSTFSELSLLSQQGRLPLIGPQRRGGWGFASICETIMAFMREDSDYRKGTGLTAADFPRGVEVEVKLDVTLPQDKLQQANIVNILAGGDSPKVSTGWALENILNINNPEEMKRQIWNEQTADLYYRQEVAKLLQAAAQPPAPPPGAGGPPPGAVPPGADQMSAGPGMAPGQADMMQGGLPPQQAGMMPGAGQGAVPPDMAGMMPPTGPQP